MRLLRRQQSSSVHDILLAAAASATSEVRQMKKVKMSPFSFYKSEGTSNEKSVPLVSRIKPPPVSLHPATVFQGSSSNVPQGGGTDVEMDFQGGGGSSTNPGIISRTSLFPQLTITAYLHYAST